MVGTSGGYPDVNWVGSTADCWAGMMVTMRTVKMAAKIATAPKEDRRIIKFSSSVVIMKVLIGRIRRGGK